MHARTIDIKCGSCGRICMRGLLNAANLICGLQITFTGFQPQKILYLALLNRYTTTYVEFKHAIKDPVFENYDTKDPSHWDSPKIHEKIIMQTWDSISFPVG
jgi:hypothetical protein